MAAAAAAAAAASKHRKHVRWGREQGRRREGFRVINYGFSGSRWLNDYPSFPFVCFRPFLGKGREWRVNVHVMNARDEFSKVRAARRMIVGSRMLADGCNADLWTCTRFRHRRPLSSGRETLLRDRGRAFSHLGSSTRVDPSKTHDAPRSSGRSSTTGDVKAGS